MPRSRVICVRLPAPLLASLHAFCAARSQQPSVVLRDALRDLLTHPERFPDLVSARRSYAFVDFCTEAQQGAVDLAHLMEQVRVPEGEA